MNNALDQTRLKQVDHALEKVCKAYATHRITEPLFRDQRAALIGALQDPLQPFPTLILNEFAQGVNEQFTAEQTPMVDDLGFSNSVESARYHNLERLLKLSEKEAAAAADRQQQVQEEEPEISSFERYYLVYLGLFVLAVSVFLLAQL